MFRMMFRHGLGWCACCLMLLLPAIVRADPADGIVGNWLVESADAVIRIERHGDTYEGFIAWQLRNTYGPEDGPDLDGKIATDRNNPDPALRSRPLDGLRLIWGLRYDARHQEWSGGHVYDSDDGHTFRCQMRLIDPDHIRLRGYVGITLLGGSSTWTRVNKFPPEIGSATPAGRVVHAGGADGMPAAH